MNGEIVKYHKYAGSSGKITINDSIAKSMNWKHKDTLNAITTVYKDQIGLFIFKKGENPKIEANSDKINEKKQE